MRTKCETCGRSFYHDLETPLPKHTCERNEKLERQREYARARNAGLRRDAILAYGGECVVCGESDHDVLQFDHKDGLQGEVRVSGIRLYARLRRENWPDYIQLLCANCHIRKTTNKNSPRPTARLSSRELTIHAAEVLSVGDRRVWREHVRSNYLIVENARGMWRVEVRPHRGQNLPFDTNILMVQQGSRSFKYTADKGHPRRWHGNFIEATEQLT